MKKVLLLLTLICFILSCNDVTNPEYANLDIRLTSSNAPYSKVLITIESIKLQHASSDNIKSIVSLHQLETNTYNLLEYKNGESMPVANTKIAPGQLIKFSIVLGSNNYIVTPAGIFELKMPSPNGYEVDLYLEEPIEYEENKIVYLDFDASQSIIQGVIGQFELQPVIRAYSKDATGGIEGKISPAESNSTISVNINNATYETIVDTDGYFCILGIPEGIYNVNISPEAPFQVKTIENIEVVNDLNTDIETIILEKEDTNEYIALTLEGDLNINPATSAENMFIMKTPSGQIDINLITSQGDTYTYAGDASEVMVMPKAEGATIVLDGIAVVLDESIRYTFTSADANMKVNLRNTKNGNGSWWISISGKNITINPSPY